MTTVANPPKILFFKAQIPGGALGDLLAIPVQVRGHTTRDGVHVAPHTAIRHKRAAPEDHSERHAAGQRAYKEAYAGSPERATKEPDKEPDKGRDKGRDKSASAAVESLGGAPVAEHDSPAAEAPAERKKDHSMEPIAIRVSGPYTVTTNGRSLQVNGKDVFPERLNPPVRNSEFGTLTWAVDTGTTGADGKPNLIGLTSGQMQIHMDAVKDRRAAEQAAWLASPAGVAEKARRAKERAHDLAYNEGGEGFNPHRFGDERSYARVPSRERRHPDGA